MCHAENRFSLRHATQLLPARRHHPLAIRDEIINLDINNLSPLQALNKLSDIRAILTGK